MIKQHKNLKEELVSQQFKKANEDYELCQDLIKQEKFLTAIGFHAQQAVEKYLKAGVLNEIIVLLRIKENQKLAYKLVFYFLFSFSTTLSFLSFLLPNTQKPIRLSIGFHKLIWSGRRVSNSLPQAWEACALPNLIFYFFSRTEFWNCSCWNTN